MTDDKKPAPTPPARPNTDDTFKRIEESGGSKPQPRNDES